MVQQQQTVRVRVYQGRGRIMVAAPLPGLEPADIAVTVSGDRLTIRGALRGPHQDERDLTAAEWASGPYHREVHLPHPVQSALTNATYGNGVLVLVLPKRAPGTPDTAAEIHLEVTGTTRGQRVGHSGHDLHRTTTQAHRRQMDQATRQARAPGGSPSHAGGLVGPVYPRTDAAGTGAATAAEGSGA
jgi:HSP20 family protein